MSQPPRNVPRPDGWVAIVPDLEVGPAEVAARNATRLAREMAPKVSGAGAQGLRLAFGPGWFGIWSEHDYMLFQNDGTRPRIMRELAGKTIPMWINDPDGTLTANVPITQRTSRTRTTMDGRRQVKIFRKAAPIGSTKTVRRRGRLIEVPRAYPGAIKRVNGRFAGRHWRHPGLRERQFAQDALMMTANRMRLNVIDVYPSKIGV